MADGGSNPQGRAKKEEILKTALQVIGANGYSGTSLQQLAEAVNLSRAGVLHYFASKEELFTEVLKTRDEASAAEYDLDATFVERSAAAVQRNVQESGLMQLYGHLAAEAGRPTGPAHDFFVERNRFLRAYLVDVAAQLHATGELAADISPETFSLFVLALSDGLQSLWLIEQNFDIADAISACLGLVVTGRPPST